MEKDGSCVHFHYRLRLVVRLIPTAAAAAAATAVVVVDMVVMVAASTDGRRFGKGGE